MYAELTGGDVENKQGTEKDKGSQQSTPAGHEDSAVRERMTPPSRAFQLSERPFFAAQKGSSGQNGHGSIFGEDWCFSHHTVCFTAREALLQFFSTHQRKKI